MHIDIHYYGTYAMARAAGLKKEVCQTIATAAQFVDDNHFDKKIVKFEDGGQFEIAATAHPIVHAKNTVDRSDQRRVWLPFHFFPGNQGVKLSEKLLCCKDNEIAQKMFDHCVSLIHKPFGLHLVGIAAHVYADTFSHYGFSGVSSRWNKVDGNSINLLNGQRDSVMEKNFQEKYGFTTSLENWRRSIVSTIAEVTTGALGHGGVLKYPDYPYLEWEFTYDRGDRKTQRQKRNNLNDYREACSQLHERFSRIGKENVDLVDKPERKFEDFQEIVLRILSEKEPDCDKRIPLWERAAENGELFSDSEDICTYRGKAWKDELSELEDKCASVSARRTEVFKFFQAAETYRAYVLRDLLPSYDIIVD